MSDVTLRRRIATLVLMAFLSLMGATVAAATAADHADAQPQADPERRIMFDDIGPQHAAGPDGDHYAFRHEHISSDAPAA
jgi:hypothetical protein